MAGCFNLGSGLVPAPDKTTKVEPVRITRPAPTQSIMAANVAVTLAVNQYVYARMVTDGLVTDPSDTQTVEKLNEAQQAWKYADVAIDSALLLASNARDASENADRKSETDNKSSSGGKRSLVGSAVTGVSFDGSADALSAVPASNYQNDDWISAFTDFYPPVDQATILGRLVMELQSDSNSIQEELNQIQKAARGSSDNISIAVESSHLNRVASVDLYVTSTAVPVGGSVQPLQYATSGSVANDSFVVNGVDGLVIMGTGASSIMIGHEKQVVVSQRDLGTNPNEATSVIGLIDLDPTSNGTFKKIEDMKSPILEIGKDPSTWNLADEVIAVEIDKEPNPQEPMQVAAVPKGNTPAQTQQNLNNNGVATAPPPPTPVSQIATGVRVDPAQVTQVIEVIIRIVNENASPGTTSGGEETAKPKPKPDASLDHIAGYYAGSISASGEAEPLSAEVTVAGLTVTMQLINSDGESVTMVGEIDPVTGVYEPETGVYIGEYGSSQVNIVLVFDLKATPISVTGEGDEDGFSFTIGLSKIGM